MPHSPPLPVHPLPVQAPGWQKDFPAEAAQVCSLSLSAAAPPPRPASFLKCHQPPHPVTLHQLSGVGPGGTWLGDLESLGVVGVQGAGESTGDSGNCISIGIGQWVGTLQRVKLRHGKWTGHLAQPCRYTSGMEPRCPSPAQCPREGNSSSAHPLTPEIDSSPRPTAWHFPRAPCPFLRA